MKKCNIHYSRGDYICFQMSLYLCPSNSLLRRYNQFGNFTLSFALFWSLKKNVHYRILCRITYVTGCYSLTTFVVRGLTCCKILQDIRLQEKYGIQNSTWGRLTISSQWFISHFPSILYNKVNGKGMPWGRNSSYSFLCTQIRKCWRDILLWACPSVLLGVRASMRRSVDRVLKFHRWTQHQKITHPYFF